jgi:hypothetical protein
VFVTSRVVPGQMGGLLGADSICRIAAIGADLPGTFKAWLADSTASPATRMTHGAGPYRRTDGVMVAKDWADFTDGTLLAPIDRDEDGALDTGTFICRGGEVWSNVGSNGQLRVGAPDCNGWSAASQLGSSGNLGNSDGMWTAGDCTKIICSSELSLYCVQQ